MMKKQRIKYYTRSALCLTFALTTSCISLGPKEISIDRGQYNNIVRETGQQQLLANIVRTRYLEVTQYIQIASLTASYSLNEGISGNVSGVSANAPNVISSSLTPNVSYSDTPTISYIPLDDAMFAKSLMAPLPMSNIILLSHAGGYDYVTLFSMIFEQFNDINARVFNQGGIEWATDESRKFDRIVFLSRRLSQNGFLREPLAVSFAEQDGCLLRFKNNGENSKDGLEFKKILGVQRNSKEIVFLERPTERSLHEKDNILVLNQSHKLSNVVYTRLRSAYSVITLLGHGVQIPASDLKKHITREVIGPDGKPYYGRKNIITIYSSDKEPRSDVLVKVIVHDHWFYIKASDLASKDIFAATLRLLTLAMAVSSINNSTPLLTIPVTSRAG